MRRLAVSAVLAYLLAACATAADPAQAITYAAAVAAIPEDAYVTVGPGGHLSTGGRRERYWGIIGNAPNFPRHDDRDSPEQRAAKAATSRADTVASVQRWIDLGFSGHRLWHTATVRDDDTPGDGSRDGKPASAGRLPVLVVRVAGTVQGKALAGMRYTMRDWHLGDLGQGVIGDDGTLAIPADKPVWIIELAR